MEGQTDSTVAVVAVLVTGTVGVVGPLILGVLARLRQRAQLAHERFLNREDARRVAVLEASERLLKLESQFVPVTDEAGAEVPPIELSVEEVRYYSSVGRTRLTLWWRPDEDIVRAFDEVVETLRELFAAEAHKRRSDEATLRLLEEVIRTPLQAPD